MAMTPLLLVTSFLVAGGPCDSVTAVNRAVADYVQAHLGKKVDRGECWDLAAFALNEAGAKWDGLHGFGTLVDPSKDCLMPGDIIQFEGVLLEQRTATSVRQESYGHHTAIVMEVHADGTLRIGHQNQGSTGRKVGISDLDLNDMVKGTCTYYRPLADLP